MKYSNDIIAFWQQLYKIGSDILSIDKKKATSILFAKIGLAILPLIQMYLIKTLIEELTREYPSRDQMIILVAAFGILQFLITILGQFSNIREISLQQDVSDAFADKIIQKTTKLSLTTLEDPASQNTLFLAQQQARLRVNQLLPSIYNAISGSISIALLVLFFLSLKAYIFLVILFFALPVTLQKWMLGKKNTDLEFSLAPQERESHYLFQVLTGNQWVKENRIFGFGAGFRERFLKLRNSIAKEKNNIQQLGLKQALWIELIEISLSIGIIVYLSIQTMDSRITLGLFILYLQGIQRLQSSSRSFFQSLLQLFQLRTFLKDLYAFFGLPEQVIEEWVSHEKDNLIVEGLSFSYPGALKDTISGIHLKANKGEVIAIVGENGSGKSTLVKLISGLYTQDEGSIRFRGSKTVLFQDFQQYQYTVEQNIHFMDNPGDNESIKAHEAAKLSDADTFIKNLAKGYQTQLGMLHQDSVQLSGGQSQKLALARIFYQKHDLVILDEPSSSLDAFAELDLYRKIRDEFNESIVLLISHRLYNLKIADRIYVMQNGNIIDEGSFQELISREGIFLSMYEKQKI
jgi:ATP-binding cassette subfamily B protein